VFKTMWKMPATLARLPVPRANDGEAIDGETGAQDGDDAAGSGSADSKAVIATGSLEDMVKAADDLSEDEGQNVIIECVGRDRPIRWPEIKGLRAATTFPDGR